MRVNPPSWRETCSFCPLQKAPLPFRPVYILSSRQLYTIPNSICGRNNASFLYQTWAFFFIQSILSISYVNVFKPLDCGLFEMLIPSWAEEEVIRSEPWVSSRQLPNSGRMFWPLSFLPQMKADRPCFLRWLLPPVSHFSESLLHQPIPVSWALILVLSLQSDPPSPGLRYLLLFSSLPQSGLDFASLVLFLHYNLASALIMRLLKLPAKRSWMDSHGPSVFSEDLEAADHQQLTPYSVLLVLSSSRCLSLGVTFFFWLSSLTPNGCVSQAFSPFLFFQFPFSSLDSYRLFLSSPQSQLPL